jgi:uncharacterized protein YceK
MRLLPALAFAVPVLALLSGCSTVQSAAEDAAGKAASAVATAAADEVKSRICAVLEDGAVSVQDRQILSGLVSAAGAAGLPAEVTAPLGRVAQAGDQVPAEAVTQLNQACGTTASPAG